MAKKTVAKKIREVPSVVFLANFWNEGYGNTVAEVSYNLGLSVASAEVRASNFFKAGKLVKLGTLPARSANGGGHPQNVYTVSTRFNI